MGKRKTRSTKAEESVHTVPDNAKATPKQNGKGKNSKQNALEAKMNKLLATVESMEGRLQKQEDRSRLRDMSPVPSAHSSVRIPGDQKLPTFDELRSDDRIQMEVQKRLHNYDHMTRAEAKGKVTDAFKSGRYRQGVYKVRHVVSWPQDYCTVVNGSRQPTYDELNVNQWAQGYIQCVLEEPNSSTQRCMLRHFVSIMQDSIELSFPTAKRAHGLILQEIEKGNVDWSQSEKIEKIRSRNTQRVWQQNPSSKVYGDNDKSMVCKLFNKGTCRYEKQSEHTDKGVTYLHYCSNCFAVTGKKYEHGKHQCLRLKGDKKESQSL